MGGCEMRAIQTTFKARLPRSTDDVIVLMRVEVTPKTTGAVPTLQQLASATQAASDAFSKMMRTGRA